MIALPPSRSLKILVEKVGIPCLIAALLLLASGTTGYIPGFGPINAAYQLLPVVLGTVLLVPAVWLLAADLLLQKDAQESATKLPNLDLTISGPKPNAKLSPPVTFSGTVNAAIPKGFEIWLINEGRIDGVDSYWPQRPISLGPTKRTRADWTTTYHTELFAGKNEESRRSSLFLVGPAGRILIRCYDRINGALANRGWIGIPLLTADMIRIGGPIDWTVIKPTNSTPPAAENRQS